MEFVKNFAIANNFPGQVLRAYARQLWVCT